MVLEYPPKVRHFVWRATSDILPTRAALFRRKIAHEARCFRCGHANESSIHMVQVCCGMEKVWQAAAFLLETLATTTSSWNWFEYLSRSLPDYYFRLAIIITWKVWSNRNCVLHGDAATHQENIIEWGTRYLDEFLSHQMPKTSLNRAQYSSAWSPPPVGYLKLNVDAALPAGQPHYTVSMVARNEEGVCIWWEVRTYPGSLIAEECEAHAALFALQCAQRKGWQSIILEGDCLGVIEALRAGTDLSSSIGVFVDECLSLVPFFSSCSFSFVKRSGNKLAHCLATSFPFPCNEGDTLPTGLASYA
ncbi:PREDICTED: uncharacterized protein LOC105960728 [Erythranthe guttata]|uniref:uncharacterized protein LOC105960728 n=1 Tax=Erythranthe guttata TaxID=4155 RepID=UPI00064D7FF1|nr:PREDICTED: uncharacterized protein LOC105960728 [Erythranthe guttata]|eukprot:XP_012840390.1 PREDICTED: uncharacterized protein LOC105960728 [Erythranthe guttata]